MRDCTNAEMRDALPDLMHGRLDAARQQEVESHVSGCAECSAELALLQRLRAAHDTAAHTVNVQQVVARLPLPRGSAARAPQRALRIAAAITVLIAGATWYGNARRSEVVGPAGPSQVATAIPVPSDTSRSPAVNPSTSGRPETPARSVRSSGISLDGSLDDFTDAELRSLLAALDTFDAEVGLEPEVVMPVPVTESLQ